MYLQPDDVMHITFREPLVIAMYGELLASLLIRSLLTQTIQKQPSKIGLGTRTLISKLE